MIQSGYQNISVSFVCKLLEFSNEERLEKYVNSLELGWTFDREKGIATIPKTGHNSDEVQRTTQFVSTDSMNQILSTFSNF